MRPRRADRGRFNDEIGIRFEERCKIPVGPAMADPAISPARAGTLS